MFKELSAPVYLQWEVTPLCNFKCIHCYNAWRNCDYSIYSYKKFYQQIVDEIIANKIFYVTITGGEPIIVFKEIKPYLMQLHEADIGISMNTNASLITDEIANELNQVGIKHVLVSVPSGNLAVCDKITQHEGSMKQIMNGINHLLNNGISVAVNMVITAENIHTIYETAKLFKHLPISSFSATRAATPCDYELFSKYRIDNNQLEFMFDELLRIEEEFNLKVSSLEFYPYCAFNKEKHFQKFSKNMCSAGKTEVAISYDGNIKPCAHATMTYGCINSGINKAWKAMNREWRTAEMIPKICWNCNYRSICAGGCKQEAYNCFQALNEIDPLAMPVCTYEKEKKKKIVLKKHYKINNRIKLRQEYDNNILVYAHVNKWALVDKKLVDILLSNEIISCHFLSEKLKIDSKESKNIILTLLKKKIIFEVE